jgi:glycogen phosphorylase
MKATARRSNPRVAYFCMEYGLDVRFKIYSGGLGILAGDHLKGARDLRKPLVALGILWKQGYVEQLLGADGKVIEAYLHPQYDFLQDTGVTVDVAVRNRNVACKVWKCAAFRNAPLYLLEADGITDKLYGGNGEQRVAQEMVLGIGGVRALRALGIAVDVYHFNEGHAVFAGLELIRERTAAGASFEDALYAVRREVVFTTHTPVEAGNETHPLDRLAYMGANQGLTAEQLVRIGGAPFNMTAAALRLARAANAVAALHGETARVMWAGLKDSPRIGSITNAVHGPTWADPAVIRAARSGRGLWETHMRNKRALIRFVAERTGVQLDPNVLLIGFSRRATEYKRWDMILRNPKIIGPLLRDGKVQIVFSGKAHPLDGGGRRLVERVVAFSRKYPGVAFVPNYDMTIGRILTRGADVWLNAPRRPLEASGTSGMKAAMNGVPNFSTLDGWWPEACRHGINGWQFGVAKNMPDEKKQDAYDLMDLYRVLQAEVLPTYYARRAKWEKIMRASVLDTYRQFEMSRMVEEYYRTLYRA